jgi:hypothetical protein
MTVTRRPYPGDDTFCTGFDVPDREAWGPAEVAFWTSTPIYQPWKDVAAYFRQHEMPVCEASGDTAGLRRRVALRGRLPAPSRALAHRGGGQWIATITNAARQRSAGCRKTTR